MKTRNMVFVIFGTVVADVVVSFYSATVGAYLRYVLILASSLWIAIDSAKMQLKRYESGISIGPVALFFGCMFLWIVAVPWYLWVRDKIESGRAVLKSSE